MPQEELGVGADVLTNHNHAPPLDDGRIVEKLVVPPLQLFRACRQRSAATCTRMSACRTCRPSPRCRCPAPGARSLARIDPRQPHPEEARPHRALPSADADTAACAREFTVYEWQPGRLLPRLGRRLRGARPRLSAQARCRPTASVRPAADHADVGVLVLAGPNSREVLQKLTRRRPRQRGFPVAVGQGDHASARRPRMRCASTSSASSAGSCIIRSSSRTPSSTR